MKRINLLTLILSLMAGLMLAGCGDSDSTPAPSGGDAGSAAAKPKPIVLKLTHNAGNGQSIDIATNHLADIVKTRTEGRVEIQVFPNNVMGPEVACRDMLVEGTTDMISIGSPVLSSWSGAIQIMQVLYAFESEEEMMHVMTGPYGQKYFNEGFLKTQNVRVLDQWAQSPRNLIAKRPVKNLADLRGLKLRTTTGVPVVEAGWTKMGVMALALALDEAFTAVQQGVCDAVEMPLEFLSAYRFYEEAKFLTLTQHTFYTNTLMINNNSWNKLGEADQKILTECVAEAGALANEKRKASDEAILEKFKEAGVEIITLTPEALKEFQDRSEPLYTELMNYWNEEIYNDFTSAIKEFRSR